MMPDHTRPFQIETDASKYATGAVLTKLDSNGDRHPSLLFQKPYHQLRGIMKSMIKNYWQLSEHLKNGGITFKDQHI